MSGTFSGPKTFQGLPVGTLSTGLSLIGTDTSRTVGSQDVQIPVAALNLSVAPVFHIDNFPALIGETTADSRMARAVAALPAFGGKIMIGPNVYTFANTLTLPDNVTLEGDGGHTGAHEATQPFNARGYTLLFTPGAALGGTTNPRRRAGSLELGNNCSLKHVNIGSLPVLTLVGNKITSPVTAQAVYAAMQTASGGVGITSLGHDVLIEDVLVIGFNIGILHDSALNTGSAGDAPVFHSVRTHCYNHIIVANTASNGDIYYHKAFPYLLDSSNNCSGINAWSVSVGSDGAAGSNVVVTNGPNIGNPVSGTAVAVCLQYGGGKPAPSSANGNLNRFGDGATATATWIYTGSAWAINLPTCPPSSFANIPTTLSFVACNDTGIGLWVQNCNGLGITNCTAFRAQTGMRITDSANMTPIACWSDHQSLTADMTSVGHLYEGQSWRLSRAGGYSNGSYTALVNNVVVSAAYGVHGSGYTRVSDVSFDRQPPGGISAKRLLGGLVLSDCSLTALNITTSNADGEYLVFAEGCQFPSGTGFMINGAQLPPPDVISSANCLFLPAWLLSTVASGPGNLTPNGTNIGIDGSGKLTVLFGPGANQVASGLSLAVEIAARQSLTNLLTIGSTLAASLDTGVFEINGGTLTTVNPILVADGSSITNANDGTNTISASAGTPDGITLQNLAGVGSVVSRPLSGKPLVTFPLTPTQVSGLFFPVVLAGGVQQCSLPILAQLILSQIQPNIAVNNPGVQAVSNPFQVTAIFSNYTQIPTFTYSVDSGTQQAIPAGFTATNSNYVGTLTFTSPGLAAGSHTITVKDANNISGTSASFVVSSTVPSAATLSGVPASAVHGVAITGVTSNITPNNATVYAQLLVNPGTGGYTQEGTRLAITGNGTTSTPITGLIPQTGGTGVMYKIGLYSSPTGGGPNLLILSSAFPVS